MSAILLYSPFYYIRFCQFLLAIAHPGYIGIANYSHVHYSPTPSISSFCQAPESIQFELMDSDEIKISWTPVTDAVQYFIEYRPVTQAAWVSLFTEESSLRIPASMETCTAYLLRMKSICSSEESIYSEVLTIRDECGDCTNSGYCDFPERDNAFEWIQSIEINGIKNNSGRDPGGKGNYLSLVNFNLTPGETVPVQISIGNSNAEFQEMLALWIDLNQDQVFDDQEEILQLKQGISEAYSGTITIPEQSKPGLTRMRIVLAFNTAPDACGEVLFNFGESEDYCAIIKDLTPPCHREINPEFTTSTTEEVLVNWSSLEEAIAYQIRYRTNSEAWESLVTDVNSLSLSTLDGCSTYEFQIRSICPFDTGPYSESYYFDTNCTTSVNSPASKESILLSPNPVSRILNIEMSSSGGVNSNSAILNIYDMHGRPVRNILQKTGVTTNHFALDLSGLNEGVYFIRIVVGREMYITKLIKIR